VPYLGASAVAIHYEEALYQVYALLHLRFYIFTFRSLDIKRPETFVQAVPMLYVKSRSTITVSCAVPTASCCALVMSRKPTGTSTRDSEVCDPVRSSLFSALTPLVG